MRPFREQKAMKSFMSLSWKAVEVLEREEPSAGNDVYLSIDKTYR